MQLVIPSWRRPAALAGVVATCVAAGFATTYSPWLTTGLVVGVCIMTLALVFPVQMLGVLLASGAVDLSFLTGGYKALLPGEGGLDMNGIRLLGIVAALSAMMAIERDVLRELLQKHGRWYLLFLLYAGATLAFSLSPIDGMRLLLKLGYPLLLFVVILGVVRSGAELERLADWTLIGAAIVALVVNPIYVLAGGGTSTPGEPLRIGTFGLHENPFSFYLLATLLLAFVRFFTRRQWRYLVLSLALSAWMVLTFTRITLLATLVALTVVGISEAFLRRQYAFLAFGGLLGAGIAAVLGPPVLQRSLGYMPTLSQLVSLVTSPEDLVRSINWQGRQVFWAIIYAQFRTSPWLGLGLGSTTALLIRAFSRGGITVAHNEYLRLAAETGLVGVVLFSCALFQWWRGTLRALRVTDRRVRELGLPALAALAAWSVISLTDNAFDYYVQFTQYVAFYCAGAILAARLADSAPEGGSEANEATSPTLTASDPRLSRLS